MDSNGPMISSYCSEMTGLFMAIVKNELRELGKVFSNENYRVFCTQCLLPLGCLLAQVINSLEEGKLCYMGNCSPLLMEYGPEGNWAGLKLI